VYENKIFILSEIFPDFKIRKGYEFVTRCPTNECKSDIHWASKKKLEISLKNDRFSCWRCHFSGHVTKILRLYGTKKQKENYSKIIGFHSKETEQSENTSIKLPEEYLFILDFKNSKCKRAYEWLHSKQISDETILQNRIGFCPTGKYNNRIIFPSFDEGCNINYFTTRHIFKNDHFKWLNCEGSSKSYIWNEFFVDWSRPIILTESIKTYLKFFQYNKNIVCNNGALLTSKYKLFSKILLDSCGDVIVAFDPDVSRYASDVAKYLWEFDCDVKIARFDNQPDELEIKDFLTHIDNSSSFSLMENLRERIMSL
jgi:hypothetical protein